jgi:hypothetical protein
MMPLHKSSGRQCSWRGGRWTGWQRCDAQSGRTETQPVKLRKAQRIMMPNPTRTKRPIWRSWTQQESALRMIWHPWSVIWPADNNCMVSLGMCETEGTWKDEVERMPRPAIGETVISGLNNERWGRRRYRRQMSRIRSHMKRGTRIKEPLGWHT